MENYRITGVSAGSGTPTAYIVSRRGRMLKDVTPATSLEGAFLAISRAATGPYEVTVDGVASEAYIQRMTASSSPRGGTTLGPA